MKWQRFEDIRIDHDLTQQQVADILNCQREVYRRYEKGIREMPLSYAIILAQYYHVSLDYLTGLSDDSAIH
nr:helix-turn-helix transcriptional regulator [Lachnospiraceae bacterium]